MADQTVKNPLTFEPAAKKPSTFVVKMTPAMAEFILNFHNPSNRALKPGVAEGYAVEMKLDRWRLTNQGIGFAQNGQLVDGQHRLFACVESEAPFITNVTVGLEDEAREVIDVGLKRSEADIITLRTGHAVAPLAVGIAKIMLLGPVVKNGKQAHSRQDLFDFFERHTRAIEFAMSLSTPRLQGVTTAPVMAVIARAFYREDNEKITTFMKIIVSGMPQGEALVQPVLLLRNWLMKNMSGAHKHRTEMYWKCETALRYYLEGKHLIKLFAASSELFPMTKLAKK